MRLHDDYADIDARVSCSTPLGVEPQLHCDIRYRGKIAYWGPMLDLWAGKTDSVEWGDGYYYTAPLLESRSEKLAWVNKAVFLAMGKCRVIEGGQIEGVYRIFKVG